MPSSERYRELRGRIRQLRNHFLTRKFDATGSYSERQVDRAAAFRLLSHAEIESYLEEIAVETANKAFHDWQQRGLLTKPLLAMLSFYDSDRVLPPNKNSSPTTRDLGNGIEFSKNRFNRYAHVDNNGIRAKDVLNLLLPVGIDEVDIDSVWLGTIDSFGVDRGDAAHGSRARSSNRVYNPPDPKTEFDNVNYIVDGLLTIDSKLLEFRSQ